MDLTTKHRTTTPVQRASLIPRTSLRTLCHSGFRQLVQLGTTSRKPWPEGMSTDEISKAAMDLRRASRRGGAT